MKYAYIAGLCTTVFLASPGLALAQSSSPPAAPQPKAASTAPAAQPLQFNDIGNIKSWKATGDHVLYVQDDKGQWYRVHMYQPCMKLYPGKTPTFITETDPQTNIRTSAVMIDRRKCQVTIITKGEPPAGTYAPAKHNSPMP
jgi:hypothetical protein